MDAKEFFNRKHGKDIEISEFPFLFIMMCHAGISGLVFSAGWYGALWCWHDDYWTVTMKVLAIVVAAGFVALLGFNMLVLQRLNDRDIDERHTAADWDILARKWMAWSLAIFAGVCSLLIFSTGGMWSPFIPFYIMVYTLALTRVSLPHPGWSLLKLFLGFFFIAGVLGHLLLPYLLDKTLITDIKTGRPKDYVDFVFAMSSMIVPYASTRFVEYRDARKKRHPPGSAPTPPAAPSPVPSAAAAAVTPASAVDSGGTPQPGNG